MTPVVVSAVLTVSLFLYNYFRLGIELMESLRNAIIMLALCVVFFSPRRKMGDEISGEYRANNCGVDLCNAVRPSH